MLHHVVTAEALTLGYVRKKMQAGAALETAGPASRLRLLAVQSRSPSRSGSRRRPRRATSRARASSRALRARWDEVRRGLTSWSGRFPPELEDRLVFRHPYAGRMTLAHALGTLEAHLDHHLPQVERALAGSR